MARIRTIKPEYLTDEKVGMELPIQARYLFIGMWIIADDGGVLRGSVRYIRSQVFPYDDNLRNEQVQKWVDALVEARMVVPLEYNGESYLYIRTFHVHQRIEKPSKTRNIGEETLRRMLEKQSGNIPVIVGECSGTDIVSSSTSKEREKEEDTRVPARGDPPAKNNPEKKEEVVLPFASDEFAQQWDRWKVYKKTEHRFSYKSTDSEQTALDGLAKLADESGPEVAKFITPENNETGEETAAKMIINKAIKNGWKGLFQLKKEDYENNTANNGKLGPGGIEPRKVNTYGKL